MNSKGADEWRSYFRESDSDIFDVIKNGIMIAAMDFPSEFDIQRDRLVEKLYTCRIRMCNCCGGAGRRDDEDEGSKNASEKEGCEVDAGSGSKDSKTNSSTVVDLNRISNYSYDEAEALTDEIDEVNLVIGEVFRIKEILLNIEDEPLSSILDSLRRLQLMALGVDYLKQTEIGKAVNGLRKHESKNVRRLARTLICGWKDMVDEWVKTSQTTNDGSFESVNPRDEEEEEEEGLPSPPLDEGVFFTTQTMELSGFFDGLDDDGNMFTGEEANNNTKLQEQFTDDTEKVPLKRAEQRAKEGNKNSVSLCSRGEPVTFTNHQSSSGSLRTAPTKPNMGPKSGGYKDEDDVGLKLEATKKKLHERYQQAENAKRQRTIQVMELHDIPKSGNGSRRPPAKLVTRNRPFSANTNIRE